MAYVKGQPFKPQFTDPATNTLMSSGTVEFYLAGTTTPTPFYTDSAGTSGGTSLTLDSGGKPSTDVFFDTAITYKLVVKNAAGGTVDTLDPYSVLNGANSTAVINHVQDAVETLLRDYLDSRHVTNVEDHGALGDYDENGTDDSAAFAAAWAEAQTSTPSDDSLNGVLKIPEGNFYLATGALFADGNSSGKIHVYGAGEGLTNIIVGEDQVGLDLSCGTPIAHDFTIWSKKTWDATVAASGSLTISRDTSGIGLRSALGGRPRFYRVTSYGFGGSGIYSTRMTKGIIDTCRVTGCGTGINIPTPSTTTTTSHITNNYVSSCDLGYNFNKVSHSTMYNNIAEGGTKGMFASLCTNSVFERMYFESNSDMHYEIKNSRCVIIDISEVDGTYGTPDNESLFYNNASVALADIYKTDISSDGLSTSHLSLQSYDDGGSANKGFVKNEFLLTQTRQLRGLRINNRETASGAINAIGTFPLVNGAKGAHVSTLHVDASGNIVTADDMVASVSRTVTGEYHITLTASAYLDWATASTYQSFVTTSTPNVLAQISYDNSTSTDFDDYEAGSPVTKIVVVTAAASTATRVNCGFTLQFGYNLPDDLLS